jgi:hypothetical protein
METKTRAILAVAAVAAIAGATLITRDSKEPAPMEGRYLRIRQCAEKKAPTKRAPVRGSAEALSVEATRVEWPKDAKPAQVECEWLTVLAQPTADGGMGTPIVVSREPALDMGSKTEVYAKGDAFGFECACSKGSDCEQLRSYLPDEKKEAEWVAASLGTTLSKGRWRGAGCWQKSCVELARRDITSWPSECPTK